MTGDTTDTLARSGALFLRVAQVCALAVGFVLFVGGLLAGFNVIEMGFILAVCATLGGASLVVEFVLIRPLNGYAGGDA